MDTLKNITILYVDDEPLNLNFFEAVFKRYFSVYTALSGAEALELLNIYPTITIVISDLRMPEMDGIQFISAARELHKDVLYFLLTAYELDKEIANALENKIVDRYFQKPFKRDLLLNEIRTILKL